MLQRETMLGERTSAPMGLAQDRTLAYFSPSPRLPTGPRRGWAASGSVGTAAWLLVSAGGNQLQTSSPSRTMLMWPEEALCDLAISTHP